MAPGCTLINDHTQQIVSSTSSSSTTKHLSSTDSSDKDLTNQIPLPSTPPPQSSSQAILKSNKMGHRSKKSPIYRSLETVDSFEILEQTIIKQKRLGRIKNTDLRKKILLKRTFNLVCEMMDQENGYDGNNSKEDDTSLTQEPKEDCDLQETLIINLNESESLDSTFQDDFDSNLELNYTDLENFNYANLLENEQPIGALATVAHEDDSGLDKNKSFLSDDFFSDSMTTNSRPNKRRRSSADDDIDFDDEDEEDYVEPVRTCETNFYMFSDLTNSNGKSGKNKRCLENSSKSQDSNGGANNSSGNSNKKFKESINIVT